MSSGNNMRSYILVHIKQQEVVSATVVWMPGDQHALKQGLRFIAQMAKSDDTAWVSRITAFWKDCFVEMVGPDSNKNNRQDPDVCWLNTVGYPDLKIEPYPVTSVTSHVRKMVDPDTNEKYNTTMWVVPICDDATPPRGMLHLQNLLVQYYDCPNCDSAIYAFLVKQKGRKKLRPKQCDSPEWYLNMLLTNVSLKNFLALGLANLDGVWQYFVHRGGHTCWFCKRKDPNTLYQRCSKCHVAMYCSVDCMTEHAYVHTHACRLWYEVVKQGIEATNVPASLGFLVYMQINHQLGTERTQQRVRMELHQMWKSIFDHATIFGPGLEFGHWDSRTGTGYRHTSHSDDTPLYSDNEKVSSGFRFNPPKKGQLKIPVPNKVVFGESAQQADAREAGTECRETDANMPLDALKPQPSAEAARGNSAAAGGGTHVAVGRRVMLRDLGNGQFSVIFGSGSPAARNSGAE